MNHWCRLTKSICPSGICVVSAPPSGICGMSIRRWNWSRESQGCEWWSVSVPEWKSFTYLCPVNAEVDSN